MLLPKRRDTSRFWGNFHHFLGYVFFAKHTCVFSLILLQRCYFLHKLLFVLVKFYIINDQRQVKTLQQLTNELCHIDKGSVVRRPDSAIHWIANFSTFVKLAVDPYNLRLRFGIYKLKFLRSIVGSRSVVSQLFG